MDALTEQFPYYITAQHEIEDEKGIQNLDRDQGYVEPGRNRPTAARAGLYGTKVNAGEKFSASWADYQRGGRATRGAATNGAAPVEGEGEKKKEEPKTQQNQVAAKINEAIRQQARGEALAELHAELNREGVLSPGSRAAFPILQLPAGEFASKAATPEGGAEVEKLVNVLNEPANRARLGLTTQNAIDKYRKSSGEGTIAEYNEGLALKYGPTPYTFSSEGAAYQPGADMKLIQDEVRELDRRTKSLVYGGNISSLTDERRRSEVEALARVYQIIQDNPQVQESGEDGALQRQSLRRALLPNYDETVVTEYMTHPAMLMRHLKDIHKMRTLLELGGWTPQERQNVTARVLSTEVAAQSKEDKQNAIKGRVQAVRDRAANMIVRDDDMDTLVAGGEEMLERLEQGMTVDPVEINAFLDESEKHLPIDYTGLHPTDRTRYEQKPHLFHTRIEDNRRVVTPMTVAERNQAQIDYDRRRKQP